MLQSSSTTQGKKRMRARLFFEPFPAMIRHRCTVKADHYCIDEIGYDCIGESIVDGALGQCPYCKRIVAHSEKDAVKV